MSEPRFLLVRGRTEQGNSTPEWPTAEDPFVVLNCADGEWVSWRLLGANNRELGRGAAVYATETGCLGVISRVQTWVTACVPSVIVRPSGQWCWQLRLDGETVAVSWRVYHRQRECRYNLGQFLSILPEAHRPELALPSRLDHDVTRVIELRHPRVDPSFRMVALPELRRRGRAAR